MPDSPLDTIRQLAKQFEGRTSSINVVDTNVCKWTYPPDRPWEATITSGEVFSRQLGFLYRGRKVRIFANSRFLEVEAIGSFGIQRLSINRVNQNDPMLLPAEPVKINRRQYLSFAGSGTHPSSHKNLFARSSFTELVRELNLQNEESLHFTAGSISVYFDRPSPSRVASILDYLINVARDVETQEEQLDLSNLPVQFHPLIPLIRKWAIDDDSDRQNFLETSSVTTLRALVDDVEPFLHAIDSYLDSFRGTPPSEEACALGRIAECVVEAKRQLETKAH